MLRCDPDCLVFVMTNYTMTVTQWKFLAGGGKGEVLLPVYDIVWRGAFTRKGHIRHEGPVIKITASGIAKELWEYHVYSEQLVTNPPINIKELVRVLSIPDKEFEAYDGVQRSNFVARYGNSGTR
jgi:hypothetical protein